MDMRCTSKLHGKLDIHDGFVEFKCNSRWCGAGPGVVVIHKFDITTGTLDSTKKFKDPRKASK